MKEKLYYLDRSNFKRINDSLARLEMPKVDEELLLEGLKQLVDVERDWVPEEKDNHYISVHLYLRLKAF